ncbi:MAG: cation:proton antiporter [Candidatus Riflebacteria bacterium]|nr:cation:proton antiporter [Candidatus Riflebacteria bacterium]
MHDVDLIATLTGSLFAALTLGYGCHRLGTSPLLGYLLAGVAVGPNTPGFVANRELANQLADLGVVLLMFGVGLRFRIDELLAVRRIAIPGALVQGAASTGLGALAGLAFGWSWWAAVVHGLAISIASTVVVTRVLADSNDLHTPVGTVAIGWLVVQDLLAVLVLVLLPALPAGGASTAGHFPALLGLAILKIAALVVAVILLGGRIIPWLLRRVAETRSRELFTLTILVVALGIAVGSARLFGVSMALGAFLAGTVVGRSDFSVRAATEALPMRDAFAVLFFVAVGMLFDPRFLLQRPWLVASTLAVVLLGTPLATLAIALAVGCPLRIGIAVALSLTQVGEFTFILSSLGQQLRILPDAATQTVVAVAMMSIPLSPLLYRLRDPATRFVERRPALTRWLTGPMRASVPDAGAVPGGPELLVPSHRAVIVGYGPVGRTLFRLLCENGIEPTIIEMNLETVTALRALGARTVYGDASHLQTLDEAGVRSASTLILSASAIRHSEEIIRLARELNPGVMVVARAAYLKERAVLRAAGADRAFAGEAEIALAMTEFILGKLGATPEQIDRERERVRADLFGAGKEKDEDKGKEKEDGAGRM